VTRIGCPFHLLVWLYLCCFCKASRVALFHISAGTHNIRVDGSIFYVTNMAPELWKKRVSAY